MVHLAALVDGEDGVLDEHAGEAGVFEGVGAYDDAGLWLR